MVRSQYKSGSQQQYTYTAKYSNRVQYHPVLTPVLLLGCGLFLAIASVSSDVLFPLLPMIGISSTQFGLSLALVLCISGILTSIVGIIELVDRCNIQVAIFPKSKEQSHANRN